MADIKAMFNKLVEAGKPTLLNTWLPPLPKAVTNSKAVRSITPMPPSIGPPLPSGLDISWTGYFSRGIDRLKTEGVKGPYKTIKEKGLMAEIKRELGIVTGVK